MKRSQVKQILSEPQLQNAKQRTTTRAAIIKDAMQIDEEITKLGINKKYYIRTYGCQMNENDSEKISAILEQLNYVKTTDVTTADAIFLNTCAIRAGAENKVFGFIGELKKLKTNNPNLIIALCGCMSQEETTVMQVYEKYPQIDIIFGTHNLHRIPTLLQSAIFSKEQVVEVWSNEGEIIEDLPVKRELKHKAWITVMYGCDRFCTYCIVPYTRGSERSRLKADIVAEAKQLVADGYQEITLLGQNVNSYGKDLAFGYDLSDLVSEIASLDIARVRIMTSNPWNFDERLIATIAKYDNVMPYVHLPLQSGNSEILKRMGRRHTKAEYIALYDKIKQTIPKVAISTDIIVGFPNETATQFQDTLDVCNYCNFDAAFTFIFSKRKGTPAYNMKDTITHEEKKQRLATLNEVINRSALNNNEQYLDEIVEVLVDGPSKKNPQILSGYSKQNKIVLFEGSDDLIGKLVNVKINKINTWSLYGTRIS